MRNVTAVVALVLYCASCSLPDELEIPPLPGPPDDWHGFSTSTIPGSDCPMIEGEYFEPPSIQRSKNNRKYIPKDNLWLFSGYIPLHLADRQVLAKSKLNIRKNSFVIRQPDASHFYFSFLNHQATSVSEYYFKSDEGDFDCHDGYIEFPKITRYGMIEGRSVNFQIRNILLKDKSGALVIQSTRGPYRGNPSKVEKEFSHEFFRYTKANSAGFN